MTDDPRRWVRTLACGAVAAAVIGLAYWSILRTMSPQLAIDAAARRALEPFDFTDPWRSGRDPLHNDRLLRLDGTDATLRLYEVDQDRCTLDPWVGPRTKLYRLDLESRDPWGRTWTPDGSGNVWGSACTRVSLERALSTSTLLVAAGRELLFALSGLLGAVVLMHLTSKGRPLVMPPLAGALLAAAMASPLVEFLRDRWCVGGGFSTWRTHGTVLLAASVLATAVHLHRASYDQGAGGAS